MALRGGKCSSSREAAIETRGTSPLFHQTEYGGDRVQYSWLWYAAINQTLLTIPCSVKLGYMARKNTEKKNSKKADEMEKIENKSEQLQLFAAFRDIWQAPVP
jgi:hypothetical protein